MTSIPWLVGPALWSLVSLGSLWESLPHHQGTGTIRQELEIIIHSLI
jgi:hypothetical protein